MRGAAIVKTRIPAGVKDRATGALDQMGLSASDLIRLVFLRVADARVTVLMDPVGKALLVKRAREAGCTSVSGFVRRKASVPDSLEARTVEVLFRQLADSTVHANAALASALAAT